MSRIAMIGVGKLGLPVSVTIALKGHKVFAYDADESKLERYRAGIPDTGSYEPNLRGQLREALSSGNLMFCDSLEQMWRNMPSIIFIAVPTPSKPDNSFDNSYVKQALTDIDSLPRDDGYFPTIAIISTVLPMSMRNEFATLTRYPLVYNPFFIAMSTVIEDYRKPEFVLLGYEYVDSLTNRERNIMTDFYKEIYADEALEPPLLHMTWEEAEICKMTYNTMIGSKIIIGNTIMEMCHNIPYANCDTIVNAFQYATKRIVGTKYLKGGMSDAGLCHPRDNRALGYLCNKLNISTNMFNFIMGSRDKQSEWVSKLLIQHNLPIVILGKRFKAGSNLTEESGSILVAEIAQRMGGEVHFHDPMLNLVYLPSEPHVFLAAIDEDWTMSYPYPEGSIVYDVWRRFTPEAIENLKRIGATYIAVGKGK